MSFTYSLSDYKGQIRLHINDTDEDGAMLADEEITYAYTEGGSTLGGGVCKAIQFIMAKVASPNFTADWLTIDNASAYKSLSDLLSIKRREFGIAAITATTGYTWRPDSDMTEEPTLDSLETDTDTDFEDDD